MKLGQKCRCPRTGLRGHVLMFIAGKPIGITPTGQRFKAAPNAGKATLSMRYAQGELQTRPCGGCGRKLLCRCHHKAYYAALRRGNIDAVALVAGWRDGKAYCDNCA